MARKSGSLREEAERRGVSVYQVRNERIRAQQRYRSYAYRRYWTSPTRPFGSKDYWTSPRIDARSRREVELLNTHLTGSPDGRSAGSWFSEPANDLINPPANHNGHNIRPGTWQERTHRVVKGLGLT